MLGVFKKRWKPKRNTSNVNLATKEKLLDPPINVDNCTISNNIPKTLALEEPKFAERSSLSSGTDTIYPLTPNICVADGRIEFIRSPRESGTYFSSYYGTDEENGNVEEEKADICDEYNETAVLEARIRELEENLEQERKLVQKEKLTSAKLQRQISRKELLQRDVDRERRLRCETESKLKLSMCETEICKTKLSTLQAQFTRMEDTVRTMVQYKNKYEHAKQDKAVLTRTYEAELQSLQETVTSLHSENQALKRQVRNLEVTGFEQVQSALLQRLESLEIENVNLRQENDTQRRKYEKCLDDVAHQVVKAILSQKTLKEEVASLRRKLRDAECAHLSSLLENRTVLHLAGLGRMWSCELPAPVSCATSLVDSGTVKVLPDQEDEEISGGSSVLRDEGYSTMSSDVQAQETPRRGLEGLEEIQEGGDTPLGSDSTSVMTTSSSRDKRYLKNLDSDMYLSVSLLLNARRHLHNPRHSFPPCLASPLHFPYTPSTSHNRFPVTSLSHCGPILPYQTIGRSLSDSHLCLNLPPALHTSVFVSDRWPSSLATDEDVESWTSGDWWDGDCVEHWLRLDEMRGTAQYDTSELEDWTMKEEERSLSPCRSDRLLISPSTCDSWSSSSDNCSEPFANSTPLGVDFTRDFYRLVKFESTKSLSSTTSAVSSKEAETCKVNNIPSPQSEDPTSRKRTSLAPNQPSGQNKLLRLEDVMSEHGSGDVKQTECDKPEPRQEACDNTPEAPILRVGGSKSRRRIISGGACHLPEENVPKPTRERITSGGSCEGHLGELSRVDFSPDEVVYISGGFPSLYEHISLEYESNNVDHLYGSARWSDEEEDRFWLEMDKERDRWSGCDKEEEIECLREDFGYELSSRGVSRSGLRSELNTVIEENEEEEASVSPSPISPPSPLVSPPSPLVSPPSPLVSPPSPLVSPPSPHNQSNSSPHQAMIESNGGLQTEPTMTRSMGSSISTPDTVVNIHDTRPLDTSPLKPNDLTQSKELTLSKEPILNDLSLSNDPAQSNERVPNKIAHSKELVSNDLAQSNERVPNKITHSKELVSNDLAQSNELDPNDRVPLRTIENDTRCTDENVAEATKENGTVRKEPIELMFRRTSKEVIDGLSRLMENGTESAETDAGRLHENVPRASGLHRKPRSLSKIPVRSSSRPPSLLRQSPHDRSNTSRRGLCSNTGWVHVEKHIDLADPKARANLLDVMLASSHSSSSSEEEDQGGYYHLHALHRFRRHKKAATREPLGALRMSASSRVSILGRDDFYVRYGLPEQQALASFDFLDGLSSASIPSGDEERVTEL